MRELPILFSTPMVQAILDGRKTVTRRVIKPQPTFVNKEYSYVLCNAIDKPSKEIKCPYGQPGDILWVRETWQNFKEEADDGSSDIYNKFVYYAKQIRGPEEEK